MYTRLADFGANFDDLFLAVAMERPMTLRLGSNGNGFFFEELAQQQYMEDWLDKTPGTISSETYFNLPITAKGLFLQSLYPFVVVEVANDFANIQSFDFFSQLHIDSFYNMYKDRIELLQQDTVIGVFNPTFQDQIVFFANEISNFLMASDSTLTQAAVDARIFNILVDLIVLNPSDVTAVNGRFSKIADTFVAFDEFLYQSGTLDDDDLTGTADGDFIDMQSGNDTVDTGAGDDFVLAGAGDDDVSTGSGDDTIYAGSGSDTIHADLGSDLIFGGGGANVYEFNSNDGADIIVGFDTKDDTIIINGAIFDPSSGAATQAGTDVVVIYGTSDTITIEDTRLDIWISGDAFDYVTPFIEGTSAADVFDGSYLGPNSEEITDFGQYILGYGGRDKIYDGEGNDIVDGGAGRDSFYGNLGADHYIGGAALDIIYYGSSTVGLTIDMVDAANSTGTAEGDTYDSVEYLHGTKKADFITGTVARIYGRGGDDQLMDADGSQKFFGGSGADVFKFENRDGFADSIADFEVDVDQIDLSLWGVTSVDQLSITERVDESGNPLDILQITFGGQGNNVRVEGFSVADIGLFDADQFILA